MNTNGWLLPLSYVAFPILITVGLIFISHYRPATPSSPFHPQNKKTFVIKNPTNNPLNILATTLPQFIVDLTDEKFTNIWTAYAQNQHSEVATQVVNAYGETINSTTSFDSAKKQLIVTPQTNNNFKPGLYSLKVTVKTYTGKDITITQDFTWGVLAINTSKGIYQPGETVKIGMAVLGNRGNTKCMAKGNITPDTAKVLVKIISPSGNTQNFSTDDGSIIGSKECAPTSVTDNPDFQTQFTVEETGTYTIHMTAETTRGERSIDDHFIVQRDRPPFTIMRNEYPTRIYPYSSYPVEITVVANQNYSGIVRDLVPNTFKLSRISNNGHVQKTGQYQQLTWQVNWRQGQTYTLDYTISFPLVSPEFYLVGPLTIGDFTEHHEWQIASDAISLVQDSSNVVNSGTSVSATMGSALTANNLIVVICSTTSNASISTEARNGGFAWNTNTGLYVSTTSAPHIRMMERRIKNGDSSTLTCTFGSSTGVKAIQIFEYTGLATSSFLDAHGKLNPTTNNCNSSPFEATVSLTATNGNELVISSHVATSTTPRSVNSHSSGFTQEFAFNGSTGTFTSADQEIVDAGPYSDTATFSGSAGTCAAVIASFITPVTLTQNGYQFFENTDSVNPVTPLGSQNQNLTLPKPHDPFRLRFLVDVDGNQTVALGGIDLVLQYAPKPVSGDCSTLTDPDWNPVTTTTPIAWNVNPSSGGSGASISTSGNDPSDTSPHFYTTRYENYYESWDGTGADDLSNLQNTVGNAQAALFDVSLVDNTNDLQSTTYCLEVVNGDGVGGISGDLDSYLQYPEVTTFYNEVNILGGTTIKGGTTIQ